MTDGYSAYNAAERATHIGCWAHARRKFVDCLPKGIDDKDSKSAAALDIIERLFSIEQGLKGMPEEKNDEISAMEQRITGLLQKGLSCSIDLPGPFYIRISPIIDRIQRKTCTPWIL